MDMMKIKQQVEDVLDEYDWQYDDTVVQYDLLDRWKREKASLIDLLRKHPNWDEEQMAIVWTEDYERTLRPSMAYEFMCDIISNAEFNDYLELSKVNWYDIFQRYVNNDNVPEIGEELMNFINEGFDLNIRSPHKRFTRVLRQVLDKYDFSNWKSWEGTPMFEKYFANLADALNPLYVSRYTAISVHPCDYLLMSNGNSWHSCYRITDGGGEYCAGTLSYMTDPCTMIVYTVDSTYDNSNKCIWHEPKINRQCFMYENGVLHQSRMYPQSEDGHSKIITQFRNVVQEAIALCLDEPNLWSLKRDEDARNFLIKSDNFHGYPDWEYTYSGQATTSLLKAWNQNGKLEENMIKVGGFAPCLLCGYEVDGDDETLYCEDHAHKGQAWCIECEEWHDEYYSHQLPNGEWVCDYCYDNYYFTCYCCGRIYHRDHASSTVEGDIVCDDCLHENYFYCDACCEYYRGEPAYVDELGHNYCKDCFDEQLFTCEECGAIYHVGDFHSIDGKELCEYCYNKLTEEETA